MTRVKLTEEGLATTLKNKFLLLDTGVIIRGFEHFEEFEIFFNFLKQADCGLVYFPFIEFEFVRGAYDPHLRERKQEFLHALAMTKMPFRSETTLMPDTIKIANAYTARKLNSPALTDCCIAAYLKNFSKNLLFVTVNHKYFPTFLFDRIFIYPIDTQKDIFPLGFYQYSEIKGKDIGL